MAKITETAQHFAKNFKAFCVRHRISQYDLQAECGMFASAISRMLSGEQDLRCSSMDRLVEAASKITGFDLNLKDFLGTFQKVPIQA